MTITEEQLTERLSQFADEQRIIYENRHIQDQNSVQRKIAISAIIIPIIASFLSGTIGWFIGESTKLNRMQVELGEKESFLKNKEEVFEKMSQITSDVQKILAQQNKENARLIQTEITKIDKLRDRMMNSLLSSVKSAAAAATKARQTSKVIEQSLIDVEKIQGEVKGTRGELKVINELTTQVKQDATSIQDYLGGSALIDYVHDSTERFKFRIDAIESRLDAATIDKQEKYRITLNELTITDKCDPNKGSEIFYTFNVNGTKITERAVGQRKTLYLNKPFNIKKQLEFDVLKNQDMYSFSGYIRDYDGQRYLGLLGGYKYDTLDEFNMSLSLKELKTQTIVLGKYPNKCHATLKISLQKVD